MKVLVTGGAGFIGSHLVKRLIGQGDEVVVIDNLCDYYSPKFKQARLDMFLGGFSFKFYKADISDFGALEEVFGKHKFEKIYHLAAQAGVGYSLLRPEVYGSTNLIGTLNLLRLAIKHKVGHFIFASSSSVYGKARQYPVREDFATDKPLSLYAATKSAGEAMLCSYCNTYGLKGTAFRFFNAYGPWPRPDGALFIFARKMQAREPLDVYDFGNGERDYTYVKDIVEGIVSAAKQETSYEVFNLGNSKPVVLKDYIAVLEKCLGREAEKKFLPARPEDVPKSHADISKAKKQLGYCPKYGLEQGISEFVKWYREHENNLNLGDLK